MTPTSKEVDRIVAKVPEELLLTLEKKQKSIKSLVKDGGFYGGYMAFKLIKKLNEYIDSLSLSEREKEVLKYFYN